MDTHPVPRKYKNNSSNGFWNPIQGPTMEFCLVLNSTNCWLCFVCFRLKDYDKVVLAIEIIYYLGMLGMIFARKATRRAAHPGFRFKAYVELATDAAQRWLPPEGELNQWGSFISTAHWCFQPSAFCGSIVSSDLNWWLFIERNPWTSYVGKYSSQFDTIRYNSDNWGTETPTMVLRMPWNPVSPIGTTSVTTFLSMFVDPPTV